MCVCQEEGGGGGGGAGGGSSCKLLNLNTAVFLIWFHFYRERASFKQQKWRWALDFLFFTVHQFPTPVFSRSFHLLLDPVYRVSAALPASLSGTFLQTVPDLVTPLEGCRKPVLGVWVSPASHKKAPVSAGTWYWRLYFSLLLGKHLPVKTCMLLLGHTKQQQQQQ